MKTEQRTQARKMRMEGVSLKKIATQLQTSTSTVSLWVRDIILTSDQQKILQQNNPTHNTQINGSKTFAKKMQQQRKKYQEEGKELAKKMEPLHIKGCMLYWAEGTKNQNACIFTNTDVNMVKLFLSFIKTYFKVNNEDFTIYFNCYVSPTNTIQNIEKYWLDELKLPQQCLRKHQVKIDASNKKNKLPYGVCTIRCGGVDIVQHIFGAISEYAGITEYCLNGKFGATTEN